MLLWHVVSRLSLGRAMVRGVNLPLFMSRQVRYNKNMAKQAKRAAKPSKARQLWLNVGKLILDATKLCFGSLVLGAAIRGNFSAETLLFVGIIVSAVGAIFGIALVTRFEEK